MISKQINIYIENYSSKPGSNEVNYTIDFHTIDSARDLFQEHFPNEEYNQRRFYNLITKNTGRHRMFAGSWYSLPQSIFNNSEFEIINDDTESSVGSAGFAGSITLQKFDISFSEHLNKSFLTESNFFQNEEIELPDEVPKKLVVANCGQGNWNEVHYKSHLLFYDFGASARYKTKEIKKLINRRVHSDDKRRIKIIISHWDMDHFQALNHLTAEQLTKVDYVSGPSNLPQSNVYRSTMEHLLSHCVNCYLIPATTIRSGRTISLNLLRTSTHLDLYRAVKGNSRNQTGIVIVIKGSKAKAILSGDHHYEKIFNAIHGKYTGSNVIFVAPHHGGNAGELRLTDWVLEFNQIKCPISYGTNSYNHPNQNLSKINSLQGTTSSTTFKNGDITYSI
jgi:beta-lactamase superfamily II metal-dependent hydrolase